MMDQLQENSIPWLINPCKCMVSGVDTSLKNHSETNDITVTWPKWPNKSNFSRSDQPFLESSRCSGPALPRVAKVGPGVLMHQHWSWHNGMIKASVSRVSHPQLVDDCRWLYWRIWGIFMNIWCLMILREYHVKYSKISSYIILDCDHFWCFEAWFLLRSWQLDGRWWFLVADSCEHPSADVDGFWTSIPMTDPCLYGIYILIC